MSYSEMQVVKLNGDVESDIELRNGWGSAPCVWRELLNKYKRLIYPDDPIVGDKIRNPFDEWTALWKWGGDNPNIRWWEHNCLHWTFDGAIIKREDFGVMSASMIRFADALVLSKYACHLPDIANRLEALKDNATIIGACHHHTSVNENPWRVREGGDGDEEYKVRPYNINTDTGHWFIEVRHVDDAAKGGGE